MAHYKGVSSRTRAGRARRKLGKIVAKEVLDDILGNVFRSSTGVKKKVKERDPFNSIIEMEDYAKINCHEVCLNNAKGKTLLNGYRVVDVNYALNKIMLEQSRHCKVCPGGEFCFSLEHRNGLASVFTYVCNVSNKTISFETQDPEKKSSSVNVRDATSTSSSYLEDFLSVLNIPTKVEPFL